VLNFLVREANTKAAKQQIRELTKSACVTRSRDLLLWDRDLSASLCFRRRAITLLAVLLLAHSVTLAETPRPTEYQVKAAYLYNFGKFVEWPQSETSADFRLCVLGEDPFGASLDSTISSATIDGKKVQARRIAKPQESSGCRIVFVASSESGRVDRDLAALSSVAALTVSDMPNFLEHGGMIQFVESERRVRFEVNLKAAQQHGIHLSSELLKVALKVQQ